MKQVVTFGEIMLRLSPPLHQRLAQAGSLDVTYGGGDANVAAGLAHLGVPAAHVGCFPDNAVGQAAETAFQMRELLKATSARFNDAFFNGDSAGGGDAGAGRPAPPVCGRRRPGRDAALLRRRGAGRGAHRPAPAPRAG